MKRQTSQCHTSERQTSENTKIYLSIILLSNCDDSEFLKITHEIYQYHCLEIA